MDSQAVIIMAMADAFASLGRTAPSAEAVRRIVGLSLPAAMAALAPDGGAALAERLARAYREAHPAATAAAGHKDAPYPGARETLGVLAARGFLLGIATGKGRNALNATLEPHGLTPFFTTFQTADRNAGKPDPEMVLNAMAETGAAAADTVVIGDTSYDMAMAVSAGVHAVGVAWGYHDTAALREAGAAHIAGSFGESRTWWIACWTAARAFPVQLEPSKSAGIAQGGEAARRLSGAPAQARPSLIHRRLAGPQP